MVITGVTPSGFAFAIPEERFSDWRTVKALSKLAEFGDISEDNPEAIPRFINTMGKIEELLFKDGGEALEKHILKSNDGYVAPVVLFQDLQAIFNSHRQTKNSSSSASYLS